MAKTNHLVIATEGPKTAGVSAEIAAIVAEEGFDLLDAPILRITSLDTPVPLASIAERYVLPMEADIRMAALRVLGIEDDGRPNEGAPVHKSWDCAGIDPLPARPLSSH